MTALVNFKIGLDGQGKVADTRNISSVIFQAVFSSPEDFGVNQFLDLKELFDNFKSKNFVFKNGKYWVSQEEKFMITQASTLPEVTRPANVFIAVSAGLQVLVDYDPIPEEAMTSTLTLSKGELVTTEKKFTLNLKKDSLYFMALGASSGGGSPGILTVSFFS